MEVFVRSGYVIEIKGLKTKRYTHSSRVNIKRGHGKWFFYPSNMIYCHTFVSWFRDDDNMKLYNFVCSILKYYTI